MARMIIKRLVLRLITFFCMYKKGIVPSLKVTRSDFTTGDNVAENKAWLDNLLLTYCLRLWLTSKIWLGWYPFSIFSQFSVFKCFADPLKDPNGRWNFLLVPCAYEQIEHIYEHIISYKFFMDGSGRTRSLFRKLVWYPAWVYFSWSDQLDLAVSCQALKYR